MGQFLKVSVALATYNGERFIREQLDSIARQDQLPDEVIVSDDASTDRTQAVVREWASTVSLRVDLVPNSGRKGVNPNFGNAFSRCRGDIILPCDQDDVWMENHVSSLAACFEQDASLLAIMSNSECVNESLQPIGHTLRQNLRVEDYIKSSGFWPTHYSFSKILRVFYCYGHGMGFRRSLLPRVTPFARNDVYDQQIFLLAAAIGEVAYHERCLTKHRQHGSQVTGGGKSRSLWWWFKAARSRHIAPEDTWTDLLDRTKHHQEEIPDLEVRRTQLQQKLHFVRFRNELGNAAIISRVIGATGQLLRGRYHHFGRGFSSYARDLL